MGFLDAYGQYLIGHKQPKSTRITPFPSFENLGSAYAS